MAETIGVQSRILGESKSEHERRGKLGEVLAFISKFAFESTVVQSLRISTVRKRGGESIDEAFPNSFNGEKRPQDHKLVAEEMQAKMEKMQDINRMKQHHKSSSAKCLEIPNESLLAKIEKMQRDMNDVALQCKTAVNHAEGSGLAKKPDGGDGKDLDVLGKSRKRVFIRSRL